MTGGTAVVTWSTAVAADSQVDYGPTTSYGNTTPLDGNRVTKHSVTISGLSAGTTYHFRVRSRDSDTVSAVGLDYAIATALPVSISASPSTATLASGGTQQFIALVSNATNSAVTWSATAGTISSSGLFTAPTVSSRPPSQ